MDMISGQQEIEFRKWTVYGLCDPRTCEIKYVGWSFDLERRTRDHIKNAKKDRSHKASWIKQLLACGQTPYFVVLETGTGDWAECERFWISFLRRIGTRLTNLTDGGDGMPGYRWTEEQKQKLRNRVFSKERNRRISEAKTGKPLSQSHKESISRKMKGRPISLDHRSKLISSHMGKPLTEEHRKKISQATKGKSVSSETRELMSAQRKGRMQILPRSEEHRRKLSESKRGKKGTPWTEEHRKKVCLAKGIDYVPPESRK
jgi:hypothetical protein